MYSSVNTIKDILNYHEEVEKNYKILKTIIFSGILLFYSKFSYSNESLFEIKGNKFTDTDVIVSLLMKFQII